MAPLPITSAMRLPGVAVVVDGAAVCCGDDDDAASRGATLGSDSSDRRTRAVAWLALLPASEAVPLQRRGNPPQRVIVVALGFI